MSKVALVTGGTRGIGAASANKLKTDPEFYSECSNVAKQNYNQYYNIETWKNKINLGL